MGGNTGVGGGTEPVSGASANPTRDPLHTPYASNSIWNTPLGDHAAHVPIDLESTLQLVRTEAVVVLLDVAASQLSVQHNDAGWSGADRCPAMAPEHFVAHAPPSFLVEPGPNRGSAPVVALQGDARSLRQGLPFARCTANGPASILFEDEAGDIYGDGLKGSNGGSGLSALGGVLRIDELLQAAPRHALAIHVDGKRLFAAPTQAQCYRWPASRADTGCIQSYAGSEPALKMGALLALPPGAALSLRTEPGKQLAWTLENFGAYVVNNAGSASVAFNVELSPAGWYGDAFEQLWGYRFDSDFQSDWGKDLLDVLAALEVVDDNASSSVGGAGSRRQPLLPPLAGP